MWPLCKTVPWIKLNLCSCWVSYITLTHITGHFSSCRCDFDCLIMICKILTALQGGRMMQDQATITELKSMLSEMKELLNQQVTFSACWSCVSLSWIATWMDSGAKYRKKIKWKGIRAFLTRSFNKQIYNDDVVYCFYGCFSEWTLMLR